LEIALLLEIGDVPLRPIACYALGRIGPAAKPAVPQLQRVLFSRDPHEKTVAAWALVNISPDPETVKTAIPLLAAALTGAERPNVRLEAARTLGKIGKDSATAKEALRIALKDPDESVRQAAEQAMK
jgi:HEAT repeat protein